MYVYTADKPTERVEVREVFRSMEFVWGILVTNKPFPNRFFRIEYLGSWETPMTCLNLIIRSMPIVRRKMKSFSNNISYLT